jgi:mannose-6-phosphate isomerase-like protein (cupin superfamily)
MLKTKRLVAVMLSSMLLGVMAGCAAEMGEDELIGEEEYAVEEGIGDDQVPGGDEEVNTPPSGVTLRVLGRGVLDQTSKFVWDWRDESSEIINQHDFWHVEITVAPGGNTGWHYHPGQAYFAVAEGTVTVYHATDPCVGEDFSAGEGLLESPGVVEVGRNHGSVNARVVGTFISPRGQGFRIDAPAPSKCP